MRVRVKGRAGERTRVRTVIHPPPTRAVSAADDAQRRRAKSDPDSNQVMKVLVRVLYPMAIHEAATAWMKKSPHITSKLVAVEK